MLPTGQFHGATRQLHASYTLPKPGGTVRRMAGAGCTVAQIRVLRRVTGTPSSMAATPRRRLPGDARSESLFAPCALWRAKSRFNRLPEAPPNTAKSGCDGAGDFQARRGEQQEETNMRKSVIAGLALWATFLPHSRERPALT
jgi:hypothetical protein